MTAEIKYGSLTRFNSIQLAYAEKIYSAPYAKLATPLMPNVKLNPMAIRARMMLLIKA